MASDSEEKEDSPAKPSVESCDITSLQEDVAVSNHDEKCEVEEPETNDAKNESKVGNDEAEETSTESSEKQNPIVQEPIAVKAINEDEQDDVKKLHILCARLINTTQGLSKEESPTQLTDSILQLLVTEDMSSIKNPNVLNALFVTHLHKLPPKVVSELLSVLIAIVKKSVFHLESTRGLLIPSLDHLLSDSISKTDNNLEDPSDGTVSTTNISLTKHFLREWVNLLIAHSCDVEELKSILKYSENDPTLLNFIQQAYCKQRNRPPAFFAFPGSKGSMISLPPFQKWPIQFGWSFSTWFYLEPKACAQPYLFNFKTGKSGLGYSAHFTGNCLVLTSIRVKGKGVQHCVPQEFPSYKWVHCAITYHNKWRASEIKVYVNGQLSANIEMPWQVQTTEMFDKCFIGGSGSISSGDRFGELNCFCGQMSAIYMFNEGLSPAQICAIHRLGASYMGQFKYSNESLVNLPPQIGKALYEEKLATSLFCLFTPVAVDSGTLCIQLAPFKSSTTTSAHNYFISAPHAALHGQMKAISTLPICSTLQSLGCSRSLLPLLDFFTVKSRADACSSLIGFLCDLLKSSPHWFANEIVQNNGFVIVACALANNARLLITDELLDIFLNLTRTLLTASSTIADSLLIKHLMDNILLNPALWIYAETKLQVKLYSYLATEFLHGTQRSASKYTISNSSIQTTYMAYNPTSSAALAAANQNYATSSGPTPADDQTKVGSQESPSPAVTDLLFGEIRRVSTVLQSLHALKYYYWVVAEKSLRPKAQDYKLRPVSDDLVVIRSNILTFIRELIIRSNTIPLDEVQGLLNYLSSCNQPKNLLDVLNMVSTLLRDNPTSMVAALDQKQGIRVLFSLIGSQSEEVRIRSLKLLGAFLARCSNKKKQEIMGPNNLFMLLCDKLKVYNPLTREVYDALIDIMVETDSPRNIASIDQAKDISKAKIENSLVIKVIATLLYEENKSKSRKISESAGKTDDSGLSNIRAVFINDLWNLIVCSKENRRTILQMSVWQHWLINLIDCTISDSQLIRDQVLAIFRVLLYHAVRYEYGGWRVWVDTLAIIHTKVSYDEFCQQLNIDSSYRLSENLKCNASQNPTIAEPSDTVDGEKSLEEACEMAARDGSSNEDVANLQDNRQPVVSSISERIPRESSGIQIDSSKESQLEDKSKSALADASSSSEKIEPSEEIDNSSNSIKANESGFDSVDLAPSREFRKISLKESDSPTSIGSEDVEANDCELTRAQSLTSIPLEDSSNHSEANQDDKSDTKTPEQDLTVLDEAKHHSCSNHNHCNETHEVPSQKATASPAFRIPEFKWCSILLKLLNDLMFSVECDLYNWRCLAKCTNLDTPPFAPRCANSSTNQNTASLPSSSSGSTVQIESILQRPENQIYIINIVHFASQLADNIIIASGGLLPLLADATGGTRSAAASSADISKITLCEGLTMAQSNSLLYRLLNMVDIVIFAATHINLGELEADKNTTSGGILRQCLRLACTVTVKNCLVVRSLNSKITSLGIGGGYTISACDFPKDMFDSYQGCSLLSANGLFKKSALSLDNSDLIANVEYSPHQTPNTSSMPSLLPFQSPPIRDANKLLQAIDISRIQACIYHDFSTESRQSQFLALSSLYFISVLMVSKYRDIIEPKQKVIKNSKLNISSSGLNQVSKSTTEVQSLDSGFQNGGSVSSVESSILSFGKIQPNSTSGQASTSNALTDMLTTKLENTLDTVCPLLKSIMCDFCSFLSKTLIGSHGQDLVNKEADRTFKRSNTSPVELVMLLCSQEWQNTLQKNAGLAFIELINEGRVLSHGMKDHIVRVAMEADFILSRLRADDVSKHEHFGVACSDTQSSRLHEENLINSLIQSAARRDYMIYCKFKEVLKNQISQNYKLDIWEDDDRRRRRFVIDSWDDSHQNFYANQKIAAKESNNNTVDKSADTKRILELQQTIEMSGINDHCAATGAQNQMSNDDSHALAVDKDDDCEDDDYDDEDDEQHNTNSIDSDAESPEKIDCESSTKATACPDIKTTEKPTKSHNLYNQSVNKSQNKSPDSQQLNNESKGTQQWNHDECGSVSDFTGSVTFAAECSLIWSIYNIPGVFQVTNHELYFEPNRNLSEAIDALKRASSCSDGEDDHSMQSLKSIQDDSLPLGENSSLRKIDLKVLRYCDFLICNGKILLSDIRAIFSRHYLLQPHALEIFLAQRSSVMFAFNDFDTVRRAVKYLPMVGVGIKYGIPQSRRASLMTPRQLFAASNMMQKWQKREIGNYQYLMFLNTIAGRTYQDLNQYPVFPWILTNYESEELDLNSPTNFRDLSKPVGALNNKRRNEFIERYQSWDNPKVPAFHYGTHYSTAAFTLNWLCRLRGSTNSAYLALQDGKYEEDSRLFVSIGDSWVSSLVGGNQNVKELIPEFFYLPEMFHSNLGLPEVEYPPWAKSAEQFVRIHRLALESELVSCQLHQWIDLIFGYKQRGPEAINAVNTFYYLTYQGNVNLNMIQDPSLRDAIETQIKHFGQTPSQLTTEPHPPRFSALHSSPLVFASTNEEVNKIVKFPFNTAVVHISSCISNYIAATSSSELSTSNTSSNSNSLNNPSSILTITNNNQYQIHKWLPNDQSGHPLIIDPQLEQSSSARRQLIDVDDLCSNIWLKIYGCATDRDNLDEVQWPCAHYVVTLDGRYIIMGSFYDYSFRVFTTESGKLCQVIYGHRGPITSITRSEGNTTGDFYLATGSQDCSVLLWSWNEKYAQVEGSGVSAVHNPLPKLTISGHQSSVLSIVICAELGIIISGSRNLILVNTTTSGENLLEIDVKLPDILDKISSKNRAHLINSVSQRPQVQDKEKTILEASMLGESNQTLKISQSVKSDAGSKSISPAPSDSSEKFSHLRQLCESDYYITNLKLARELAFIVCIALPPPYKKSRSADGKQSSRLVASLLMTFNLKGSLMDCTTLGEIGGGPKFGDVCTLQVTRDGEHLILNDSPTTLKVFRTFDLQPVYGYNTNGIPNALEDDQNRVRSLALLDKRFVLVGLENGKIIVYNFNLKSM